MWLEDQKIRHYTVEDREALRQVSDDATWPEAFKKVSEHSVKFGCQPALAKVIYCKGLLSQKFLIHIFWVQGMM